MGTGKGMETFETLPLNDSRYHPGREQDNTDEIFVYLSDDGGMCLCAMVLLFFN